MSLNNVSNFNFLKIYLAYYQIIYNFLHSKYIQNKIKQVKHVHVHVNCKNLPCKNTLKFDGCRIVIIIIVFVIISN